MHLVSPPFHAKGKVSTMQETLYDLVEQVQSGQNDADLILYERFRYLLERYFRKLRNNEDAKQDLIVAFLELIPHIPLSDKCCSDEQIAAYIKVSIHHAFIKISKQQAKRSEKEFVFDFNEDEILEDDIVMAKSNDVAIEQLAYLEVLTDKQKQVIFLHYFCGCSIKEIANILGISRQTANKIKNTALKNLKKNYAKWIM